MKCNFFRAGSKRGGPLLLAGHEDRWTTDTRKWRRSRRAQGDGHFDHKIFNFCI